MPGERLVGRAKGENEVGNNWEGKREKFSSRVGAWRKGGGKVQRGSGKGRKKRTSLCVLEAASSTQNLAIVSRHLGITRVR